MSNARSFSGKKGQMVLPGGNCENMIALTQLLLKANNICISLEGLTQVLNITPIMLYGFLYPY